MNLQPAARTPDKPAATDLATIEEHIRSRLTGRVRDFRLVATDQGLVLKGQTHTYYAKQLAQQAVLEAAMSPIRANEIEVL